MRIWDTLKCKLVGRLSLGTVNFTNIATVSMLENLIVVSDDSGSLHFCQIIENQENSKKYSIKCIKSFQVTQGNYLSNIIVNIQNKNDNEIVFDLYVTSGDYNIYLFNGCWLVGSDNSSMNVSITRSQLILGYNDEILDICQIFGDSSNGNNSNNNDESKDDLSMDLGNDNDNRSNRNNNSNDDYNICVATNSNELRVINLTNFNCDLLYGHNDTIMGVACHQYQYLQSSSNKAKQSDKLNKSKMKHRTKTIIGTASKDKQVRFWLQEEEEEEEVVKDEKKSNYSCIGCGTGHSGSVNCIVNCNSKKECWFISGSRDGSIRLWDIDALLKQQFKQDLEMIDSKKFEASEILMCHEKEIMDVDISWDDKYCASVGMDCKLVLYQLTNDENSSHESIHAIKDSKYMKGRAIWCVKFCQKYNIICTGHNNGEIRFWSLDSDNLLECIKVLDNKTAVLSLCFLINHNQSSKKNSNVGGNEEQLLLTSHSNGILKMWNFMNNECIARFEQHYSAVWALCALKPINNLSKSKLSNDKIVISGGTDSIINVWFDERAKVIENELKEKHELIVKKSEINNYIVNKEYTKAVKLCIELNEPRKLLRLFKSILYNNSSTSDDNLATNALTRILMNLNGNELGALLSLIVDWNCNGKHGYLSQMLLYIIYNIYDLNDIAFGIKHDKFINTHKRGKSMSKDNLNSKILNLDSFEIGSTSQTQRMTEMNSALNAYSKRHLKRVNNLIKQTYLIDYVLDSIDNKEAGLIGNQSDNANKNDAADGGNNEDDGDDNDDCKDARDNDLELKGFKMLTIDDYNGDLQKLYSQLPVNNTE